jgi:hypothetical protein
MEDGDMRERTHLVCQYLENISRNALEEYQDIIRGYVKHRHGVYALYRRGELYYVGLASNLRSRLHNHLKDRHGKLWERFSVYLTVGDSHMREIETLILHIVKPTPAGNKQKGKFPRAKDMRRQFDHDVKTCQRAEREDMLGRKILPPKRKTTKTLIKGRKPVLLKYANDGFRLRAHHKGKRLAASVRRDGRIRFNGKLFTSPSLAAVAACKRPTADGWTFWQYQRAPGDWVLLDEMRKG